MLQLPLYEVSYAL